MGRGVVADGLARGQDAEFHFLDEPTSIFRVYLAEAWCRLNHREYDLVPRLERPMRRVNRAVAERILV